MADVRLKLSASAGKPLTDRAQLRLHLGTQEVPVTVALLEGEQLRPGGETYAQLRSREQFVPCPGDRFVLRTYSPPRTVGGGKVLDHGPRRHKGRRPEVVTDLAALDASDPAERLAVFLRLRREEGMTPSEAQAALAVTLDQARNLFQSLVRSGRGWVADRKAQRHVDAGYMEELEARAIEILTRFHTENPLKRGFGVEELRTKFPDFVSPRLVAFALERLREKGQVAMEGELVRKGDFAVRLSHEDETLRARILETVRARGFEGPTAEEEADLLGEPAAALRPVLDYLASGGVLVRTKEGFYFDAALIDSLVRSVIARLAEVGEVTVADLKALTNATRKYTIPLLEYLDGRKITQRRGEVRVAGAKGKPA